MGRHEDGIGLSCRFPVLKCRLHNIVIRIVRWPVYLGLNVAIRHSLVSCECSYRSGHRVLSWNKIDDSKVPIHGPAIPHLVVADTTFIRALHGHHEWICARRLIYSEHTIGLTNPLDQNQSFSSLTSTPRQCFLALG